MQIERAVKQSAARKTAKVLVKVVLLGLIASFWYAYVRRHWHDLRLSDWHLGWAAILLACLVTSLGYVLRGVLWSPLRYELIGQRMGLLEAFRVSALAWSGRYLPGKIWSLAGKAYLSANGKDQLAVNAVAVSVDILWFQVSGILLGGTVLLTCAELSAFLDHFGLPFVLVALGGLMACHPRIFCPLVNRILRQLRQPELPRRPRYGVMLLMLVSNMLTFTLWTGGWAIIAHAVCDVGLSAFPVLVGLFAVAWVCGFLAVFAPAGIGVRDAILALGLQGILALDPSNVVLLVVASRLLSTAVELVCLVLALVVPRIAGLLAPPQHDPGT